MLGVQRLLWLPADYREVYVVVKGQMVFFVHSSGFVNAVRFDCESVEIDSGQRT